MENNAALTFGVPNLRTFKTEKYPDFGVITLEPVTGKKAARRFVINPKGVELMGLNLEVKEDEKLGVGISFPAGTTDIYIANLSLLDSTPGFINVGKTTHSFSDRKTYDYIKKILGDISEGDRVELKLVETSNKFNDFPVFKLELLTVGESEETEKTQVEQSPETELVVEDEVIVSTKEETVIPVNESLIAEQPSNDFLDAPVESPEEDFTGGSVEDSFLPPSL